MHRPSVEPQDPLSLAIAEATAAFDAANHAFGRFVTYVVRRGGRAIPPSVQTVREAFQEAAIAVPQESTTAAAAEFLPTLVAAQARLGAFFQSPPDLALEEARPAEEALAEAIGVLEGILKLGR